MSTLKDTIDRHRKSGRGRKATWIAVGVAALVAVVWSASPVTGREETPHRRQHWGHPQGEHTLTDLAGELREHDFWLAGTGFTAEQTERLADLLDQRRPAFETFASEQSALTARITEVLTAPELNTDAVDTLREEAKRLAAEAIEASFDLMIDVAQELTLQQRADLTQHWEER